MKRRKRTKAVRLRGALEELNKAMDMRGPHIQIYIPWGISNDMGGKTFTSQIKTFVEAYKKYYDLEKIDLELVL